MSEVGWAEQVALHAISRGHKWTFECIDCRALTTLHFRLKEANESIDGHNAKVAAADIAHADEPTPRAPHEGDYYRGLRDGLGFVIEEPDTDRAAFDWLPTGCPMTRTLALAVLVCLSGSRPGAQTIPALVAATVAGPTEESDPGHRTPPPMASRMGGREVRQRPAKASSGLPRAGSIPAPSAITGVASWGRGWAGVVTRLPRGTRICVTGSLGRWCGRSVGYGPEKWTGRIADLSASVFTAICGPLSRGLCRVTLAWS